MVFLGDVQRFTALIVDVVSWGVLTVTVVLLCQAAAAVWRSLQRVKLQEKVLPVPPGAHWLFGHTVIEKWEELGSGSSVDVFHHLSLMTLDNMLKCALGQNTDCQTRKSNEYIAAVHELAQLTEKRGAHLSQYFLNDFLYINCLPAGKRYKKARDSAHRYSEAIIQERRKTLDHPGSQDIHHGRKYLDFLDILLKAKDEDGNGLTDAEIRDEVDTFVFEGHDTTASGLAWTLYCLARHPGHQEKCRKEAQEEFNPLRFAPENSKNRSPYAFLPFAAGPRNCIGQHFAMNELKTAVALILQRFSLTPDDTLPEPVPEISLVTRVKPPGLFLQITAIN
uniref:Uncharacterized protein n=1 Tax=Branchiostoma floridae TaxID=7739 RepID=C3XRR6_BRAFL|eukprot:XP_002613375.1 hypothetical protein BRAFLDRAFT_68361 [Branchiostoma floridae]